MSCVLLRTAASSTAAVSLMMHTGREREAARTKLFHSHKHGGSKEPHRHKVQPHMSTLISLVSPVRLSHKLSALQLDSLHPCNISMIF